jgi:hypothetical protein
MGRESWGNVDGRVSILNGRAWRRGGQFSLILSTTVPALGLSCYSSSVLVFSFFNQYYDFRFNYFRI